MYPRPLSEKTLKKRYAESGLTANQVDFLHGFFLAGINLYGAATISDLWEVYKELRTKVNTIPALHKKDLVIFSGIVQREAVPYYILEINEIYSAEPQKDTNRFVVSRDLVGSGVDKYKYINLYNLDKNQINKPFYVPADFMEYGRQKVTDDERKLLTFLGNLKVTAKEYELSNKQTIPCTHIGEKLKDFDFLSQDEQFEYDYISGKSGYIKGNQKKAERFLEDRRGPENEKIVRDYKFRTSVGWPGPKDTLDFVIQELDEVGVQLKDGQLQELLDRLMDFANHSHLWCNRGWTPDELHKQTVRQGPPLISLGPGIQKAIADGDLDFEELRRELARMGIRIIDSN